MKIISWNINSVRARLNNIQAFIDQEKPDIIAFQEIKCQDHQYPYDFFNDLGYNSYIKGQKSYNGVAFLSRNVMDDLNTELPNFDDEHARFISGWIPYEKTRIHIINGYMPNGNPVHTEKYSYKLNWMRALLEHVASLLDQHIPFILCGDFNIIPTDFDVHAPEKWREDALFQPEVKDFFHTLCHWGLTDAVRFFNPGVPAYSFWDYQGRAREQDHGIRIDHFLTSGMITDRMTNATILDHHRDATKASDHAPIMLTLE